MWCCSISRGAFFVEHGAVFDGVDPCADCGLDADRAFSVGHDFFSGTVGDFNCGGHLGFAQFLHMVSRRWGP